MSEQSYATCASGLADSGGAVSLSIHLVTDLLVRAGAGKLLDWQFTGTWAFTSMRDTTEGDSKLVFI